MICAALEEAALYHDHHRRGFFATVCDGNQRCYPLATLPDVLASLPTEGDVFISQAEFVCPSRRLVHLARLPVCFADLEIHKSRYSHLRPEQAMQALLLHCQDTGLPVPTIINDSGRGVHVKYILDKPIPAEALPRWNALQKCLSERLADFGADRGARDGSRCLRVVGSVNPRSGRPVRAIWVNEAGGCVVQWDFDLLCREVLPVERQKLHARRQQAQRAQSGRAGVCNLWPPKLLWWNRLSDVRTLIALRGWQEGVPTGYRDHFLFIATCAVAWSAEPQNLEREVAALAAEFTPTISPAQIRSCTVTAIRKAQESSPYRFSTARLIELLDVQPAEQRHLKTICGPDERRRRRKVYDNRRQWGKVSRADYERQAQERRQQAQSLRVEGQTYPQIAAQMGSTIAAIDKLLRRA